MTKAPEYLQLSSALLIGATLCSTLQNLEVCGRSSSSVFPCQQRGESSGLTSHVKRSRQSLQMKAINGQKQLEAQRVSQVQSKLPFKSSPAVLQNTTTIIVTSTVTFKVTIQPLWWHFTAAFNEYMSPTKYQHRFCLQTLVCRHYRSPTEGTKRSVAFWMNPINWLQCSHLRTLATVQVSDVELSRSV